MKRIIRKMKGGEKPPARPQLSQVTTGLIGGALGIGIIASLIDLTHLPLLMAPLGATCVLLFAAPDAHLAQPRHVIGGNLISTLIGLFFLKFIGSGPLEMGLSVGCAIAVMQLTRTLHPPAGAVPLLIILSGTANWQFLMTPVLASTVILVMIALVINNLGKDRSWPRYW